MANKRAPSKRKKINPHFWVFCEGETEESYVCFLRSKYRLPIEIVPKIVGNKITPKLIRNSKQNNPTHPKDRDFLMYDADVPEVLEKLRKIDFAELIISNPCIELWFLLHYKNQTAHITTSECIKEVSNRNRNTYKKGTIDNHLEARLTQNCFKAVERTLKLKLYDNPSTSMYQFLLELEKSKKDIQK
jgi:hypothetical protein